MIALPAVSGQRLLIVGGSARSAAFAAVRAGFVPCSYDLFADLDTAQVGPAFAVAEYPHALPLLLEDEPRSPLMYVGALENAPDIIANLGTQHELWGVSPETLRKCRASETLAEVLRMARAPSAAWRSAQDPPPADGEWMIRPLAGSGGQGIHVWDAACRARWQDVGGVSADYAFQQRIVGVPYSALFLGNPAEGDVQFVGVTRQLVGESAFGAEAHMWCGNIGPATLPVPVEQLVRRVGNIFKWKVGLQGIFGVDFLLDAEARPWVTEVNPRYPASAELLEWATQNSLLAQHARCFGYSDPIPPWQGTDLNADFLGKAVVYASTETAIPLLTEAWVEQIDPWAFPAIGDVPRPGTTIKQGQPLCTVYASAESEAACFQRLASQAAAVRDELAAT